MKKRLLRSIIIMSTVIILLGPSSLLGIVPRFTEYHGLISKADYQKYERLQRKHGAVAVATNFSHCVRLNGERIELR